MSVPATLTDTQLGLKTTTIPYGIALGVFLLFYIKFLLSLPKRIMILFIVSGAIFVAGAIGFEMLASRYFSLYGDISGGTMYAVFYTFEEFFEMLGIVIFIYTLLSYIAIQFGSFTATITDK